MIKKIKDYKWKMDEAKLTNNNAKRLPTVIMKRTKRE